MKRNLRIARGQDIGKNDLIQIIALNRIVYGPEATPSLEKVECVLTKNSDTCLVIRDDSLHKVVGYMSALPLVPAAFDRILDEKSDETFEADDIIAYDYFDRRLKFYNLYLASVVVDSSWRKQGIFQALYVDLLDILLSLGREHKILFRNLAARALPQGEKICLALGMKQVGLSGRGEKIFHAEMPPPFLGRGLSKGKELVRFYAEALKGN